MLANPNSSERLTRDESAYRCRSLMKDGVWLVPESQRVAVAPPSPVMSAKVEYIILDLTWKRIISLNTSERWSQTSENKKNLEKMRVIKDHLNFK